MMTPSLRGDSGRVVRASLNEESVRRRSALTDPAAEAHDLNILNAGR
jgi:hypothetical protein